MNTIRIITLYQHHASILPSISPCSVLLFSRYLPLIKHGFLENRLFSSMMFRTIKYKPLFSSGISKSHMIFIFSSTPGMKAYFARCSHGFPIKNPIYSGRPMIFPWFSHSGISQWPNHHVTTTVTAARLLLFQGFGDSLQLSAWQGPSDGWTVGFIGWLVVYLPLWKI